MSKSKFDSVFQARKTAPEPEPLDSVEVDTHEQPAARAVDPEPPAAAKRGRPATGKRSKKNEYTQVTAYVKIDTHAEVQAALAKLNAKHIKRGTQRLDFSGLIENLLTDWLSVQD